MGYGFWRRVGVFRHGHMADPAYALKVFDAHFSRSGSLSGKKPFTALELGPGDTLFSALIAHAHGAERTWLVDAGAFAETDMDIYRNMAGALESRGLSVPFPEKRQSLEDCLKACQATYLTRGLASFARVPDSSVDFIWSQAVLEHIRLADFAPTLAALRRVVRPDGICSHRVDLKDHLGGASNNLRFSGRLWEADWMAESGFYTNRIGFSTMLEMFKQAGFEPEILKQDKWDTPRTPRKKLAKEFAGLSDEDLLTSGFDVLLRPV